MHFYQKNIGDFNNATRHLTRVERSLFSDAIELYYDTEKPLTSDFDKLCRLLLANSTEEQSALRDVLNEFFTLVDNAYFNKRCNEEILKYHIYMDSKSKAGKASAEQRAKQKSTGVQHVSNRSSAREQLTNTQYPIPNTQYQIPNIKQKPPRKNALDNGFNEFWNAYPKKVGKADAQKKWDKISPPIDDVLNSIAWQRETEQWTVSDGKYIPNPSTYIFQQRWTDEKITERPVF